MIDSRHEPDAGAGASIALGILTVDAGLVITTWNQTLAAWTGIAPDRAQGRPLTDVVPSIGERGLLSRFEDVLATGQVQLLSPAFHRYLIPCAPPSASPLFEHMQQRCTLGPLRDGDRIIGVIATIEDVTARLDAERRLADALRSSDSGEREAAIRNLADAEQVADPSVLARALRDDSWRVRGAAVRALERHADRDTLVGLLNALRSEHGDFNVLNSALQLLAASEIDVTGSLVSLLDDADPDLRMQAALALGQQDRPTAAPPLLALLDDPDVNVRFHAIEALGRLRAGEAVERLADIATSGDFFLAFPAMDALTAIGDSKVAPRLLPFLRTPELATAVAGAIGELAEADAVPDLVHALNGGSASLAIIAALARLHARYERFGSGSYIVDLVQKSLQPPGSQRVLDALAIAGPADLRSVIVVMGWLSGDAVGRALTRMLAHPDLRPGVIEAIVRQGAAVVDLLVDQLEMAEDVDTRSAAITALGRIGDRRAVPALVEVLASERALAIAAAGALAAIGDAAAFSPLLPLLGHRDPALRQAVIGALNSLGHPDMPAAVRTLLDSERENVRESGVRIAGYFGYEDCTSRIVQLVGDQDENVRRAAVEQLPHLDDVDALDVLARAIETDTPKVRASAVQALGQLDSDAATDRLLAATLDADPWVRYFAARSLSGRDTAAVRERLGRLAADDPAVPVRLTAIEALGQSNHPSVVDALLPHVDATDPQLASAALSALGALDDERAVAALLSAVRSDDANRRLSAVRGLSRRLDDIRVEALQWTAGADPDDAVATSAVAALTALARIHDDEADRAINALLALTADARHREEAVAGLARARHRITSVAAGLRAADPEVRRAAVEALSRLHHGDATTAIRTALDDREPSVRRDAVVALHRLGARGLERVFAAIARNDAAREVRRAAAAALVQTRLTPAQDL